MDRLPYVANETVKWNAKLLYLAQRASVARTISLDEPAIRKYYAANQKRYIDEKGNILPFEQVRTNVVKDYAMEMENIIIIKHLELLKKKYPININEELLTKLSKLKNADPRAVDAVIYKPGGTFPRVAFPSIDERWSQIR